jgi:hypothetical protein
VNALRAIILAAAAAAALAGCGGSHPNATGTPGQATGGSHPPAPTASVAAAATPAAATPAAATPAAATPAAAIPAGGTPAGGSAAAAALYLESSEEVPFTGDVVTLEAQASPGAGVPRWLRLASVTISFGDGTSASVTQQCSVGHQAPAVKGLALGHSYRRAGLFTAEVTSASICGETGSPDLSGVSAAVRVLPAAPAASASWPQCAAGEVRIAAHGTGAGLGHVGVLFTVHNISAAGCRLLGYPGLRLLGSGGNALPTTVHDAVTGTYLFPPVAPHRVALPPGGYAAFELEYGDNPTGPQASEPQQIACPAASQAEVTLPGASAGSVVAASMAPCGGDVWVSPVIPGRKLITFP